MVKIMIMNEEALHKKTIRDIHLHKVQKEDKIIYFNSLNDFRKVFTTERIRLLSVVRESRPNSLYALAKILSKDLKNVRYDAKLLESFGLLSLERFDVGLRQSLKPRTQLKKLEMAMAI